MDLEPLFEDLGERLLAGTNPERAAREKTYLRRFAEHLCVSVPGVRKVLKSALPRLENLPHTELGRSIEFAVEMASLSCRGLGGRSFPDPGEVDPPPEIGL